MKKQAKRFKLIVTDVEPTGSDEWPRSTPDSFIDIKLAKGLKPCVRARVTKTLADIIVHSHNTDNSYSAQKYKLTVADVEFSNSEWRRFRPCSIIDTEVAQGLHPLARARVESTLARVREFYVVGYPYPVVIAPPDRPFMGSFLKWAAVITILLCGVAFITISLHLALRRCLRS
ncbi:hypothetical protein PHJA_001120800 [Phtheirospermum japonicum]|uniref:Uncharacterized protein n=1 Tax=Phtheirospermum japonicum TaxID=374723 RepID=A0A830BQG8_9LAMI|nr:hypothetical protein PHJA_001120800 [Phtheirospermum japonicum]